MSGYHKNIVALYRGYAANEHQDRMKSQEDRDRRKYQPNQGIQLQRHGFNQSRKL